MHGSTFVTLRLPTSLPLRTRQLAASALSYALDRGDGRTGVCLFVLEICDSLKFLSVDIANSIQPSPLPNHQLSPGHPEITQENPPYKIKYDTSKEQRILGIPYKTKFETTKDMLKDFAQKGW